MATIKEVTYHYTCDGVGCNQQGSGLKVPPDWRWFQLTPHQGAPGEGNPPEIRCLLCPGCSQQFRRAVINKRCPQHNPAEQITITGDMAKIEKDALARLDRKDLAERLSSE